MPVGPNFDDDESVVAAAECCCCRLEDDCCRGFVVVDDALIDGAPEELGKLCRVHCRERCRVYK